MADPIACIIIEGTPILYISDISSRSGLKPLKDISISGFFLILSIHDNMPAAICPITVASAAPDTPIFGAPRSPKISMGSRIILMIAPVLWVIIVSNVLPVDVSSLSKMNCANIPKDITQHIVIY